MLKIFRNLRQKMLGGRQAWKYLLYAAGEITLVTIGILIALQVKLWYDNQKDQATFESYIEQLKVDVETAIKNAENVSNFSLEQEERSKNILDYLLNPESNIDFESYKEAVDFAGRYRIIVINVGNLGELLSGELDNVYRNPALVVKVHDIQNKLEVNLEVAQRFARRLEKHQGELIDLSSQRYLENYPIDNQDWRYDSESLRNSPRFLESIRNLSDAYSTYSLFANRTAVDLSEFKAYLDTIE